MADLRRFLWSLFDLNGSASRKRGWIIFGLFVLTMVCGYLFQGAPSTLADLRFLAIGLALVLLVVVTVQRLHATGRSGYWSLLALIPYVGILFTLVILGLPPRDVARQGHPVARRVGAAGLAALAGLFVLRAIYFQPYWIPSESMKPTLLVGDFLIATRVQPADLQRGDVIVFRHPVSGFDHINRLVGLPGDRVQMKGGMLFLNGEAVPQEAAGSFEELFAPQGPMRNLPRCENGPVAEGDTCTKSRMVETLPGGRSYSVLNIEAQGPADETDVFTVPEGQYFILGDNRDNSNDSRFAAVRGGVGFVPAGNIKHRARVILFSSAGRLIADVFSWRPGRYFEAVR